MSRRSVYPKRLFTLMVLCIIGFNSLLLLVSGIVYYGTYSEIAYREIRTAKEELLDETSQKLSNYVKSIQDTALFLVTNSMVHQNLSAKPDSFYDYVSRNRDLYEDFQKLATVKEGVLSIELYTDWLVGYPPIQDAFMHTIAEAETEGWLERMNKSDGFWIAAHDSSDAEAASRIVSYVHRIAGLRGELLGIVKINIPDEALFSILNNPDAKIDHDRHYIIMDSRGSYIAALLPPGIAENSNLEHIEAELAGTKYSVIESDMNSQSWMLKQIISKDVLQQGNKHIRSMIVMLLSALILLSIPLAFWVTRKLTSPIYEIVDGMRAIEKGDFNVRLGTSSIQEYLYLTTHFNRMVQRLKDLIGQLNQEHRNRREVEIQLLHAQIKPHFLYNTLDLIHWRALDYNAHDISQMVQQLSKLFRIGLSNDKWYVTVRDELLHARCYMAIQEYRQTYDIDYVESVDHELLDAIIPKIVLQPFLENAVVHGFQYRKEKAEIKVSMERIEAAVGKQQLCIKITDNGKGLPSGFDLHKTKGIGIRNVIERIHLYCGLKYGVRIAPGEQEGAQVIIHLPLIRYEEEMEQLTRSYAHEYDSFGG